METAAKIVLLVEDEASVRAIVRMALRLSGYIVLEAGTAEEAVQICRDAAVPIDLVVTDLELPGMGGLQLTETLLHRDRSVRTLLTSGGPAVDLSGMNGLAARTSFLPKPFSVSQLTAKIQEVLGAG